MAVDNEETIEAELQRLNFRVMNMTYDVYVCEKFEYGSIIPDQKQYERFMELYEEDLYYAESRSDVFEYVTELLEHEIGHEY
ncbi:hypothetical protein [Gimesia sp.]|uniref:hypothetical protein n=1 Tax=Gimesia sp. TaxID=2024833 RepID=UPI003A9597F5